VKKLGKAEEGPQKGSIFKLKPFSKKTGNVVELKSEYLEGCSVAFI
jgi:hypothetical protein